MQPNTQRATPLPGSDAPSTASRVLALARRSGVLRPRDLAAVGIAPEYLYRLLERGLLVRLTRGVYALAEYPLGQPHPAVR